MILQYENNFFLVPFGVRTLIVQLAPTEVLFTPSWPIVGQLHFTYGVQQTKLKIKSATGFKKLHLASIQVSTAEKSRS